MKYWKIYLMVAVLAIIGLGCAKKLSQDEAVKLIKTEVEKRVRNINFYMKFPNTIRLQYFYNNEWYTMVSGITKNARGDLTAFAQALKAKGWIDWKREWRGLSYDYYGVWTTTKAPKELQMPPSKNWMDVKKKSVCVCKGSFIQVLGVSTEKKKARAEFKWKWIFTEVGSVCIPYFDEELKKRFGFSNEIRTSHAYFTLYDTGWKLDKIDW